MKNIIIEMILLQITIIKSIFIVKYIVWVSQMQINSDMICYKSNQFSLFLLIILYDGDSLRNNIGAGQIICGCWDS
jgi:hypothetical protein